jgi:hypothetical protein
MAGTRNACSILVENPEWKRSIGRPKLKLEDNIKMYFKEMG